MAMTCFTIRMSVDGGVATMRRFDGLIESMTDPDGAVPVAVPSVGGCGAR